MELKVFTMKTCPNCPAAKKIAQEVAQKYGAKFVEVDIGTPEGQIEGLMYQVMSTPSIAIDKDVIARGKLVAKEELEEEVKKRLKQ
ncbi:MAG: thioredoxin family protein [Candidatus Bathyarchaeia archaeon]